MDLKNILWNTFKQTAIGTTINTIGRLCSQPEKELKNTVSQMITSIPDAISVNTKIKDFPIHANIDMVGIKEEVEKYTNVTHRKQVVYFESNGIIPQEKIDEMNESLKRSDYL